MEAASAVILALLKLLERKRASSVQLCNGSQQLHMLANATISAGITLPKVLGNPLLTSEVTIATCEMLSGQQATKDEFSGHNSVAVAMSLATKCIGCCYYPDDKVLLICKCFIVKLRVYEAHASQAVDLHSVKASASPDKPQLGKGSMKSTLRTPTAENDWESPPDSFQFANRDDACYCPQCSSKCTAMDTVTKDAGMCEEERDALNMLLCLLLLHNAEERSAWLRRERFVSESLIQSPSISFQADIITKEMHFTQLVLKLHRKSGVAWSYKLHTAQSMIGIAKGGWKRVEAQPKDCVVTTSTIESILQIYLQLESELTFIEELTRVEPANYSTLAYCSSLHAAIGKSGLLEESKIEHLKRVTLVPAPNVSNFFSQGKLLNLRNYYKRLMNIAPQYFGCPQLFCSGFYEELKQTLLMFSDEYALLHGSEKCLENKMKMHCNNLEGRQYPDMLNQFKATLTKFCENELLDSFLGKEESSLQQLYALLPNSDAAERVILAVTSAFQMLLNNLEISSQLLNLYNSYDSLWAFRSTTYTLYLKFHLELMKVLSQIRKQNKTLDHMHDDPADGPKATWICPNGLNRIYEFLLSHGCYVILVELYASQLHRGGVCRGDDRCSHQSICKHEFRLLQEANLFLYDTESIVQTDFARDSELLDGESRNDKYFAIHQTLVVALSQHFSRYLESIRCQICNGDAPNSEPTNVVSGHIGLGLSKCTLLYCKRSVFSRRIVADFAGFLTTRFASDQ